MIRLLSSAYLSLTSANLLLSSAYLSLASANLLLTSAQSNAEYIASHNRKNSTFAMAENQFSSLTWE